MKQYTSPGTLIKRLIFFLTFLFFISLILILLKPEPIFSWALTHALADTDIQEIEITGVKFGWRKIQVEKVIGTLLNQENRLNLAASNIYIAFPGNPKSDDLLVTANHLSANPIESSQEQIKKNSFLQIIEKLKEKPNFAVEIKTIMLQLNFPKKDKIELPEMKASLDVRNGQLNFNLNTVSNSDRIYHLKYLIDSLGNTRGQLSRSNDLIFIAETNRTEKNQLDFTSILDAEKLNVALRDEEWEPFVSQTDLDLSLHSFTGTIHSIGKFKFPMRETVAEAPYFSGKVKINAGSIKKISSPFSQIHVDGDLSIEWKKSSLEFSPKKGFSISSRSEGLHPKVSSRFLIEESGPLIWEARGWEIPSMVGDFSVKRSRDIFTGNLKFSRKAAKDNSFLLLDHEFSIEAAYQDRLQNHATMEGEIYFKDSLKAEAEFFESLTSISLKSTIIPLDSKNYGLSISGDIDNLQATKNFLSLRKDILEELIIEKGTGQTTFYSSIDKNFSLLDQTFSLLLNDVRGSLNGYQFNGLDALAKFKSQSNVWESEDINILLGKLNLGFELKNIKSNMKLESQTDNTGHRIIIRELEADIFNGKISLLEESIISLTDFESKTGLVIKDWELEEILDLYPNQGISGTGKISGQLPVSFSAKSLSVNEGRLYSMKPGGTISVKADENSLLDVRHNKNIATMVRLLKNFQYKDLEIDTNLNEKGDLILNLVISGSNPEELKGQPIILNVNIEQNLLDLIKSMTIASQTIKQVHNLKQGKIVQ